MEQAVAEALARVKAVFSARPKPRQVPHCSMCYKDEEVSRFLAIPYGRLTMDDLRPILWDAYVCWGTWREVAYYIPRLLELYWEGQIPDDEQFYARLLAAVRPELMRPIVPNIGEQMADEERLSLFEFFQAMLEERLAEKTEEDRAWIMTETVSFLAAFDSPIAPLLARLQDSQRRQVRGNVCLFLADHFWEPAAFDNTYLKKYSLLPDNQAALNAFFAPAAVAVYLLDHLDDMQVFAQERRQYAEMAFDYALAQAEAQGVPNLNPQQVQ